VLIVCPDAKELASMAGALAGHFTVLAAHGPDEARRLLARHGPCRLAYFEAGDNAQSDLASIRDLGQDDMELIALVRPPCPLAIRKAAANGRIQGICLLPLSAEALLAKTRAALSSPCPATDNGSSRRSILTREEVAFLLGSPLLETPLPCRPSN
jgi:hypothetical protein